MIEDLEVKVPLKELVSKANISMVTFQAIFKQIYGDSPYAHLKKYKMNCAAIRLRDCNESISQKIPPCIVLANQLPNPLFTVYISR